MDNPPKAEAKETPDKPTKSVARRRSAIPSAKATSPQPVVIGISVVVVLLLAVVVGLSLSKKPPAVPADREEKEQAARRTFDAEVQARLTRERESNERERLLRELDDEKRLRREQEEENEKRQRELDAEFQATLERHARELKSQGENPADTDPKPKPKPQVDLAKIREALSALATATDDVGRQKASQRLRAFLSLEFSGRDAAIVAYFLGARTEEDAGFRYDSIRVKNKSVETQYEGEFEQIGKSYIVLRLRSGETVAASKAGQGGWNVTAPGNLQLAECEIKTEENALTKAGAILDAHLKAYPPASWIDGNPIEESKAARSLADALQKSTIPDSTARSLLYSLIASHGVNGSDSGEPKFLEQYGFLEKDGCRQFKGDAPLLKAMEAYRTTDPEKGLGWMEGQRVFRMLYIDVAIRMLLPMKNGKSIPLLNEALQKTLSHANTDVEAQHVIAILKGLSGFKPCSWCAGLHTLDCDRCAGKGKVKLICGNCNGHGTVIVAGVGGGSRECPSCSGAGDKGTESCGTCHGDGRKECKKCDTPFVLPEPGDIVGSMSCTLCAGMGSWSVKVLHICPRCLGLGSLLVPQGNKLAILR